MRACVIAVVSMKIVRYVCGSVRNPSKVGQLCKQTSKHTSIAAGCTMYGKLAGNGECRRHLYSPKQDEVNL